mmetsp:Transcript_13509/g.33953  ORF Transcript_13509/g.33953 Transcript_13509/m.33953 type:complete len:138 (+) Transcript_13509:531-944(+)
MNVFGNLDGHLDGHLNAEAIPQSSAPPSMTASISFSDSASLGMCSYAGTKLAQVSPSCDEANVGPDAATFGEGRDAVASVSVSADLVILLITSPDSVLLRGNAMCACSEDDDEDEDEDEAVVVVVAADVDDVAEEAS